MTYSDKLFEKCYYHLLKNEGGYANDPDDSGGETYKGVARKFWGHWDGWEIIDSYKQEYDFPNNLKDNIKLDELIRQFYREHFWDKMNLDKIVNENTVLQLFDMGVNSGIRRAAQIAQGVCGVKPDGIIGSITAFSINSLGYQFTDMFIKARIKFYKSLVEKKPKNKKFLKGWIRRAEETKFTP